MTNTRLPPVRRAAGTNSSSVVSKRSARRRRWPAWIIVAVSLVGVVVAIVATNTPIAQTRLLIAIGGFALVIVGGTVMLFVQRVLDVGVARLSGTPLISRFDLFDKAAFALLLIASVSNGVVIALQVARQ